MVSLDVDSWFTDITLDETIDICVDSLYNDKEVPLCMFFAICFT